MKSPKFLIWLAAGLFFLLGVMRLNNVNYYSPDSTLYVLYGNSLAHCRGIVDDTRPEPRRFDPNAPLYAALLAPVELVFPKSIVAAKIWTLLWGCAGLVLLYHWLASLLGEWYALAGVSILALNPMFLVFSTEALSEAPFIVFLLICFREIERFVTQPSITAEGTSAGVTPLETVLFVLVAAFTPVLREVGFALVGACVLYLFVRRKAPLGAMVLISSIVVFGLWYYRNNILFGLPVNGQGNNVALVFRHIVTPPSSTMFEEFIARIWLNGKAYSSFLGGMIFFPTFAANGLKMAENHSVLYNGFQAMFDVGVVIIALFLLGIMLAGLFADFNKSKTALLRLLFLLLLGGILLVYPAFDARFLLPALPCLALYLLRGAGLALERLPFANRAIVGACVLLLFVVPNASAVAETIKTNLAHVASPTEHYVGADTLQIFYMSRVKGVGDWIEAHAPEDAVIASPIEDLAPWIGERKMLDLEPEIAEPVFESQLRENNVNYIYSPRRWEHLGYYEFLMSESKEFRFVLVGTVADDFVLRVESKFRPPVDLSTAAFTIDRYPIDTATLSGLTRLARREFLKNDFTSAVAHLERARNIDPTVPEPLYQLFVVNVMLGDSAAAFNDERELLTFSQTLSYSLLASALLNAFNMELQSKREPLFEGKIVAGLSAAEGYWNAGYREHAGQLLDFCLGLHANFPKGLLTSFRYNLQLGDTARARWRLEQLTSLDSTKAILKALGKILLIGGSIDATVDGVLRSRKLLELAKIFQSVHLTEEAEDEAERAIGADPRNIDAYTFLALEYRVDHHPRTALRLFREAQSADPSNAGIADSVTALGAYLASQ